VLQVDFGEFEVTLFKQHVRELVKRQVNRQRTPQRTLLRDKIAFVLGTMGAMCGRMPPALLGLRARDTCALWSSGSAETTLLAATSGAARRQTERVLARRVAGDVLPAVHGRGRRPVPAAVADLPHQGVRRFLPGLSPVTGPHSGRTRRRRPCRHALSPWLPLPAWQAGPHAADCADLPLDRHCLAGLLTSGQWRRCRVG